MNTRRSLARLATLWVGVVVAIGIAGGFRTDGGPPLPVHVAVTVPLVAFALAYALSSGAREVVLGLDPRMVLAAQLWRIAGAAFLFGWAVGELPDEFAVPAGIGDVATGITAALALAALLRGTLTRRGLLAFSALGRLHVHPACFGK